MSKSIIKIRNLSHQYEDGSYGVRVVNLEIDEGAFENWLLDLRGDGDEEVILEEKND